MRKNLDYGLLHAMTAFLRVVDAGSFTAAASQMGLTTAQISRLVSELENRLQTKLLQRTTRRLAVTSAGERYANQCRSILDLVTEAESAASGASVARSGLFKSQSNIRSYMSIFAILNPSPAQRPWRTSNDPVTFDVTDGLRLRVLCMTSFGNRYVVPLVSKYCAMYPKVTVEYSTSQYVPDLLAEGIDVSVYLARRLADSSNVAQQLGGIHGILCAAPAYLEQHGSPRTVHDLVDHTCLRLVNPSTTPHWELTDRKNTYALDPADPPVGDTPEAVLHGACSGLGIAMLPPYSVVDSIRRGELVHVLPRWRSPEVGVYMLMPSRKFLEAKTRAWLELLRSELPAALERDASYFDKDVRPKRRRRTA